MPLNKPFRRIYRPTKNRQYDYVKDILYAKDRLQLSRAYLNIERKLKDIFNYIEPADCNIAVFSFELYSILLRACTEVELNCKAIMEANEAIPTNGREFTMNDYKKLNIPLRLSDYQISYPYWRWKKKGYVDYYPKIFNPFSCFNTGKSPRWYQKYNSVKHSREQNFDVATLNNCMRAVAAILVLLYAQFGPYCIETNEKQGFYVEVLEDYYQFPFLADVIFELKAPVWTENDCYDFDWSSLKKQAEPFDKYPF